MAARVRASATTWGQPQGAQATVIATTQYADHQDTYDLDTIKRGHRPGGFYVLTAYPLQGARPCTTPQDSTST
ncbi:hypothetical protein ACF059_14965 [Streptomyces sp. NPDC016562]|uniref:hypothetical protein n=1 Tax=Streptomyces sp. NPDC016562 TaxID=3364966 RepID=UPI0036F4EA99